MPSATTEAKIPRPKPGDVKAPIPGEDVDALFAELMASKQQGSPSPVSAPDPASLDASPSSAEAPAPPEMPSGGLDQAVGEAEAVASAGSPPPASNPASVDDLFKELQAFKAQKTLQEAPTAEGGDGAPVFARLVANAGKEPEVQRQLLQRTLGLEYDTKVQEDAVWFRKKGEKFFLRMDPEEWGVMETIKDLTVDIAPDLAEGLVSTTVAAIAARAGAVIGGAAGLASGGPAGVFPGAAVGFGAGAVLGVPAGGALAALGRGGLVSALGAPNEVDLKKEAAFNSLATIAGVGISQVFRRPAAAILDKLSGTLANTKMARVSRLAKVRESVEEFSKEFGVPEPRTVVKGAELGRQIDSVVDITEQRLNEQVGLVKNKALMIAKEKPLAASAFQSRAKEILENEGVTFDEVRGIAKLPADLEKLKPFGEDSGQTLKQIVNDYNAVLRNGGMNMKNMFNNLDFYKAEAGFQKARPDAANAAYQRLRGALREDRDKALTVILPEGSSEAEYAKKAFGQYKENIDEVRKLQRLANKSPEKFAESLIAPKESQRVLQLKQVLGENSPAFSNVKAAWYSNIIEKSVDPETGIVVGATLKKELDKYGPDVLNELMSKEQQRTINAIASKASKIAFADLIENPTGSAFFKDFFRSQLNGVSSAEAKFRVAWSLAGNNKKVAKYLSDKGLLDLAKEIRDPEARSATVKAADWMSKMVQVSEVTKTKAGKEMLKPLVDAGVVAGIINAMEPSVDESMPEYLQRKKEQLNALRRENGVPLLQDEEVAQGQEPEGLQQ